jgi:hypothetical protein
MMGNSIVYLDFVEGNKMKIKKKFLKYFSSLKLIIE